METAAGCPVATFNRLVLSLTGVDRVSGGLAAGAGAGTGAVVPAWVRVRQESLGREPPRPNAPVS
jgi:hypothetical protein